MTSIKIVCGKMSMRRWTQKIQFSAQINLMLVLCVTRSVPAVHLLFGYDENMALRFEKSFPTRMMFGFPSDAADYKCNPMCI